MWYVARPFVLTVLITAVVAVASIAVGAVIGLPGIFLAFILAVGSILVFISAIVSVFRIFKWVGDV